MSSAVQAGRRSGQHLEARIIRESESEHAVQWAGMTIPSATNMREHFMARARRVKAQRQAALVLGRLLPRWSVPLIVTFCRVAPRPLDSDNLANAFKAVRDGVADALGVSDAPSGGVEWLYSQRRGAPHQHAVEVFVWRPTPCRTCQGPVERVRWNWAVPTCEKCLPPPRIPWLCVANRPGIQCRCDKCRGAV